MTVEEAKERMTVAEVNALLYSPDHPRDRLEHALRIEALSPGWRASFEALLQSQTTPDGSGNAGLEILSKLRLDFVKIDRSLLVKAIDDKGARGVLAGIIAIARETGSYLIAEGVESRALLDFACNAHDPGNAASPGIRGVQGYLLGRPELGQVNLRAREGHSTYLASRSLENAAKPAVVKAA